MIAFIIGFLLSTFLCLISFIFYLKKKKKEEEKYFEFFEEYF